MRVDLDQEGTELNSAPTSPYYILFSLHDKQNCGGQVTINSNWVNLGLMTSVLRHRSSS